MKFLRMIAVAALAAAILSGCKKDKEEDALSLYGTLSFSMPSYVTGGDVYHLVPSDIVKTRGDKDLVGYKFHNPFTKKTDTLRLEGDPASKRPDTYLTISTETVGTYTVSFIAFADGYTSKSASKSIHVVDTVFNAGSVSGITFPEDISSFTDPRDGREYPVRSVGGRTWMLRNLSWNGAGQAYRKEEKTGNFFGRFYTWDEALSACPEGWRLPEESDWIELCKAAGAADAADFSDITGVAGSLMGDALFEGSKMWEDWPDVPITNSTGLSFIPMGYATADEDGGYVFEGYDEYSLFWTASPLDDDYAIARYVYVDKNTLFAAPHSKRYFAAPIRCVKD